MLNFEKAVAKMVPLEERAMLKRDIASVKNILTKVIKQLADITDTVKDGTRAEELMEGVLKLLLISKGLVKKISVEGDLPRKTTGVGFRSDFSELPIPQEIEKEFEGR